MKRSEVKDVHEKSVLVNFKKYYAVFGKEIKILEKPEPPDAIISINGKITWIEITDAFFSAELAESITSHVADDKAHKPVPKERRFCVDPDEQFSSVLESVIIEKYDKVSIGKIYEKYGSGILLVGIINPFSDAKELIISEKAKIINAIKLKEQRFSGIYLYDVHDHVFRKLL